MFVLRMAHLVMGHPEVLYKNHDRFGLQRGPAVRALHVLDDGGSVLSTCSLSMIACISRVCVYVCVCVYVVICLCIGAWNSAGRYLATLYRSLAPVCLTDSFHCSVRLTAHRY